MHPYWAASLRRAPCFDVVSGAFFAFALAVSPRPYTPHRMEWRASIRAQLPQVALSVTLPHLTRSTHEHCHCGAGSRTAARPVPHFRTPSIKSLRVICNISLRPWFIAIVKWRRLFPCFVAHGELLARKHFIAEICSYAKTIGGICRKLANGSVAYFCSSVMEGWLGVKVKSRENYTGSIK